MKGVRGVRSVALDASSQQKEALPWWGGDVVANALGEYVQISLPIRDRLVMPFPNVDRIRRNLRLVYGIGAKIEEELRQEGYQTLDDLAGHPRWGRAAGELLRLVDGRRLDRLQRYGAKDDEILGFFNRSHLVVLDLETTGFYQVQPLFLIGTITFDDEGPVLRQYLARNYDEEPAALRAFMDNCGRKTVMVSYNGRSFDYPYLTARFRYHRLEAEFAPFQLDLLPPTRRSYRSTLPDCRLRTVEEELLGVHRTETFTGAKIPELYHRFIAEGDPRLLTEVIEHNAQDILSMASLLQLLSAGWQA